MQTEHSKLLNDAYLDRLIPLVQERIANLSDFIPMTTYFFGDDFACTAEELIPKNLDKKSAYRTVKSVTLAVDNLRDWQAETIERCLKEQVEVTGWSTRDLFMTVRRIITGRKATPGLYETMEVLGKARCQARMRSAMKTLRP